MFPFDAANIAHEENPPYTREDFFIMHPQFTNLVSDEVLDMYLQFAHSSINIGRWKEAWKIAIGLFMAHWCTLHLESMKEAGSPAATVVKAGQTKGLVAAKSVDSVSVSYDFSNALEGLDGWAGWKLTSFGVQLATMGKLVGMGGMYVR